MLACDMTSAYARHPVPRPPPSPSRPVPRSPTRDLSSSVSAPPSTQCPWIPQNPRSGHPRRGAHSLLVGGVWPISLTIYKLIHSAAARAAVYGAGRVTASSEDEKLRDTGTAPKAKASAGAASQPHYRVHRYEQVPEKPLWLGRIA